MVSTSIKILFLTTATLSLAACGATTNGLGKALAQKAASQAITAQMASDEPMITETTTTSTTVVMPATTTNIASLNMAPECQAIATKVAAVDARILAANEILNGGDNVAGQAVASVATQAAVHNGAAQVIGKVPFGGLFAKAAMDGVSNSGKKKAKRATKDLNKATLERAKLEGMYAGKGC
jgi:hypothetical protein